MRVTQVLCAAGPVDAVTNQALACRALFKRRGWDGADYAPVIVAGMSRRVRPLDELRPSPQEVLLLHYSGYAREVEELFNRSEKTMLLSHNITPARYFWAYEPVEGVRCELARGQLAELAARARALAGVSEYNAAELRAITGRDANVLPVLFERAALPAAGPPPSGPPVILFVGRLAPHKRQDLVIRSFARYRQREPDARLVLVGTPLSPEFGGQLKRLADELAPGAVSFEAGISRERLAEHYRSAHVFLCLSEHEGFCIPLLEAFHFGVPVIARDAGAVAEVAGDAAVLLGADDNPRTVAELLRIVTGDGELRDELRARAARRLEVYDYDRAARRLLDTLTAVAA